MCLAQLAQLARRKYEDEHPEMSGQNLKHDSFQVLKQAKKVKGAGGDWVVGAGGGRVYTDYDEETATMVTVMDLQWDGRSGDNTHGRHGITTSIQNYTIV